MKTMFSLNALAPHVLLIAQLSLFPFGITDSNYTRRILGLTQYNHHYFSQVNLGMKFVDLKTNGMGQLAKIIIWKEKTSSKEA